MITTTTTTMTDTAYTDSSRHRIKSAKNSDNDSLLSHVLTQFWGFTVMYVIQYPHRDTVTPPSYVQVCQCAIFGPNCKIRAKIDPHVCQYQIRSAGGHVVPSSEFSHLMTCSYHAGIQKDVRL